MRMITLDATGLDGRDVAQHPVMINIDHITAILPEHKGKSTRVIVGERVYTVLQKCPKIVELITASIDF